MQPLKLYSTDDTRSRISGRRKPVHSGSTAEVTLQSEQTRNVPEATEPRVAGGRWRETGDEWREQESGGAWLGQAMGDKMTNNAPGWSGSRTTVALG
ncbi:hypothetical protein EYF80_001386 [Liparis tanakae]|uniref:Uncharacterized protein n=1 Tax=Liparis tanakae TaxID=230148 RepID=A0A4Z2JFK8_9TELE|nr:hypothetical protein EYF80_001386 [Liparis tanakae]